MFNATFNNISVILWQSVLLLEETEVPGRKPPTCHKSLINFIRMLYRVHFTILLLEETGVPGRKPPTCHKSLINFITMLYRVHFTISGIRTPNVSGDTNVCTLEKKTKGTIPFYCIAYIALETHNHSKHFAVPRLMVLNINQSIVNKFVFLMKKVPGIKCSPWSPNELLYLFGVI